MKQALLIITYNTAMFISEQVKCIKKFCKDDKYAILVVDNSDIKTSTTDIEHQCAILNIGYYKVDNDIKPKKLDPSNNHAFGLRYAFNKFKTEYDVIFFLDHDIFPIKDFSVTDILKLNTENKLIAAGLLQGKDKNFFWAGCFVINMRDVDLNLIGDFSTNYSLGLDTNADSSNLLKHYDVGRFCFFTEDFITNTRFINVIIDKNNEMRQTTGGEVNDPYKEYQLIKCGGGGAFLHFRGASNYVNCILFGERIGSLFSILNENL